MAKKWTEEERGKLRAYREEGLTIEQIANKLNRSADSIDHALRRYKIPVGKTVARKEEQTQVEKVNTLESLDNKYFEALKKKAKTSWTIKKTTVKPTKNKQDFTTYLVLGDLHIPEHNMPAIKSILYMMDDIKFDGLVNIGDFCDFGCISHWNKTKKLTSEGMKLKEDYIIGNSILDEFDKRLPEGCDKHFMYGNHESHVLGTKILTEQGWLNIEELELNDKIAQFDINDGKISFVKPTRLHEHFSEKVYEIESLLTKQTVTPNHHVVLNNKKVEAHKLLGRKIDPREFRLTGYTSNKGLDLTYDELKLLTWIIMDGTIVDEKKCHPSSNKIRIQFKLSKKKKINNLLKLLKNIDVKHTFRKATKSGLNILQPYYIRIYGDDARKFYKLLDYKKEIPQSWRNLNYKQTEAVLKTITRTDGSKVNSKYIWKTVNKRDLDMIEFLCITQGFVYKEIKHKLTSGFKNSKKQYGLYFFLNKEDYKYHQDKVTVKEVAYNNMTYCVTVPDGNIITKKDGKIAFSGNSWYYDFIECNPMLEGMLNPKDELYLEKRGYKVYEHYNDIFRIGQLNFTHGIYTGLHYVKKHIDELKTNVIFGHLHSQRERYESSPAKQLSIAGYALGCLCSMSPGYMKGRPNKWTNGFAVVYFYPNGDFEVRLIRIIRGKFIFDGKVYNGNR